MDTGIAKRVVGVLTVCALAAVAALAAATSASAVNGTTICDDFLPPGVYGTVVVPEGAACFSNGPIGISGGLFVEAGATFVLGSDENFFKTGWISNGVHGTDAMNLQIHFATIVGGIDVSGGSGPFGGPFEVTWNTIEDSIITGDVTMDGYDGFWMGFIRNHVVGDVNLTNNVLVDPDGNEYVTNTIRGDLNCSGNDPAPQIGDSEGSPNVVLGQKTGQCVGL